MATSLDRAPGARLGGRDGAPPEAGFLSAAAARARSACPRRGLRKRGRRARAVAARRPYGVPRGGRHFDQVRDDPNAKRQPGVEARMANITELPFADREFDAVRADRALQHVGNVQLAVHELCRVTKPGGVVYLGDSDGGGLMIDAGSATHLGDLVRADLRSWSEEPARGSATVAVGQAGGPAGTGPRPARLPGAKQAARRQPSLLPARARAAWLCE